MGGHRHTAGRIKAEGLHREEIVKRDVRIAELEDAAKGLLRKAVIAARDQSGLLVRCDDFNRLSQVVYAAALADSADAIFTVDGVTHSPDCSYGDELGHRACGHCSCGALKRDSADAPNNSVKREVLRFVKNEVEIDALQLKALGDVIDGARGDAPEGPWTTCYTEAAPHIWAVIIPRGRWAFTGSEHEAIAVRDALNRLDAQQGE